MTIIRKTLMIFMLAFIFLCFQEDDCIIYGMGRIANKAQTIRILVESSKESVRISGKNLRISNDKGDIFSCRQATIQYKDSKLFINNHDAHTEQLVVQSDDQMLRIGKHTYRGVLKVIGYKKKIIELVNIVDIDVYLKSVVGGELSSKSHMELLKAQAIAARTYALYHINSRKKYHYDLKKNAMAYKGVSSENMSSALAVKNTDGIVMTYRGKIFPSFFHASCGGYTIEYHEVFSGQADCPGGVKCIPCLKVAPHEWTYKQSVDGLKKLLIENKYPVANMRNIQVERNMKTDRVFNIIIDGVRVPSHQLRKIIGPDHIKSTIFWMKVGLRNILFKGKGWGHGIGMCQYGAEVLANKGWDYKKILTLYYRGIKIKKI